MRIIRAQTRDGNLAYIFQRYRNYHYHFFRFAMIGRNVSQQREGTLFKKHYSTKCTLSNIIIIY